MADKKNDKVEYTTLSANDKLNLVRDRLRALESDHFRLTLASPELEPTRDSRLPAMADEIARLQALVSEVERGEA